MYNILYCKIITEIFLLNLPWLSSLVPPEFDPSKKLILVKAPPKGTRLRKFCEIQEGGLNLRTTVNVFKRLFNRNIMSKEKEGSDVT